MAIENAQLYQIMQEKTQQLTQILSSQKSKTEEDTNRLMQFVRGIEIHEQRLKMSREEAEQLAGELQALVAATEDLVERLKVQEKDVEDWAEGWRT